MIEITEGDSLGNTKNNQTREMPKGPPPALTATKPLNNEWTVCSSGINYDALKIKNGWDFRVVKKTAKTDYLDNPLSIYGIHQVYIDENGDITRIEDNPVAIFDENLEKLSETLEKIKECLKKPVIDYITGEEI